MNKLFIIGNLTRDPELRSTGAGIPVCSFTVAVNRRKSSNAEAGQPEADYFRVAAWRQLGENCAKYLAKGRKVAVVGSVQVSTYTAQDGTVRANMEVNADDVEFLSPANQGEHQDNSQAPRDEQSNFIRVDDSDDPLPF
jgi:single-strand DNA-binding protein